MALKQRQHPVDRDWAWVVFAAVMGSEFLIGSQVYLVGVVHAALLDKFQPDTITMLALTGAVFLALVSLTAPVSSYIINRFGCRTCCVLSGLLCFAGHTSSAFATSVLQLLFTYGITAGLGVGLAYASSNVVIGFYFDRLRGVAAGITNGVESIGILTTPIVFQKLIEKYDIRGAFLLLGAFSLHFCFFGMFYRPTIYEGKTAKILAKERVVAVPREGIEDQNIVHEKKAASPEQTSTEDDSVSNCDTNKTSHRTPLLEQNHTDEYICSDRLISAVHHAASVDVIDDKCVYSNEFDCHDTQDVDSTVIAKNVNTLETAAFLEELKICSTEKENKTVSSDCSARGFETDKNKSKDVYQSPVHQADLYGFVTEPSHRSDVTFHSKETSLSHFCEKDNRDGKSDKEPSVSIDFDDSVLDATAEEKLLHHSHEDDSRNDSVPCKTSQAIPSSESANCVTSDSQSDRQRKSGMVLLRLLKSSPYVKVLTKAFLLHCAAVFLCCAQVAGVLLHLPEYAKLSGLTPVQRGELFVALGAFSLVSRLASGFATADTRIDPLILNIGLMGLNGVITCFFPLYPGSDPFIKQMVFSSLFGLYFGGLFTLVTPTLVRFLAVERLAHAFGVCAFSFGVGYIIGPPLAGLMALLGSFFDMGAACFLQPREKRECKENDPSSSA